MLFNSIEFVLLFLPLTLVIYYFLLRLQKPGLVLGWLFLASLFFYGWWNPIYVFLLLISITVNFVIGQRLLSANYGAKQKKALLFTGLVFNIGLLAYFKYTNFLLESFEGFFEQEFDSIQIILPLAISFFTFQQIAFLVDAFHGKLKQIDFLRYCVFVSFFPQLIAGPIVHHSEIFPQLKSAGTFRFNSKHFAIGLSQFSIGLFKKVIIADSLAQLADPVFAESAANWGFTSLDHTVAVAAFSLQIYFDFSAYSDMALGLGRMFSIRLPNNFNSPYKASSIIEFWQRWHMTLSRFLKNYLYIPLGGNRHGEFRRYLNLMLTMLLGGLWHGAQWQFVFWGFLHGSFLSVNHLWRQLRPRLLSSVSNSRAVNSVARVLAHVVTLLSIVLAWVFFRAESMSAGLSILSSLFAFDGSGFSGVFYFIMAGSQMGLIVTAFNGGGSLLYLLVLIAWVLLLPNCQELFNHSENRLRIHWKPNNIWVAATAIMLIVSVFGLGQVNEFIYFQF